MDDGRPFLKLAAVRAVTAAAFAALLLSCAERSDALAQGAIEDFESAASFRRWEFSNGGEFPGGAGAFRRGEGSSGRGGVLEFAFSCVAPNQCGAYVAASLDLAEAGGLAPHGLLSFQALPYEGANIAVRLRDESGQTLQYPIAEATVEQQSAGWRRLLLPLDRFTSEHWGGADTGRVSGRIVNIAFLARGGAPMRGALGLDDIQIVDVTQQNYRLNTQGGPRPGALPVDAPEIGVNIPSFGDPAIFDAARAAGVSFVRADLTWNRVENRGAFDFSEYAAGYEELRRRGLQALWILDYGHRDHGGGGAVQSPGDRAAFARYAAAAAARFRGRGARYEIWNEPDVEGERYFAPAAFAVLMREAAAAIRTSDARAPIVTGGISWGDLGYFHAMLGALGEDAAVAAIGFHAYGGGAPENLPGDVARIQAMSAHSLRRAAPVWVTEWGYSSAEDGDGRGAAGRTAQGVHLARQMLTAWAAHVPVAVWYELQDRGESTDQTELNFGLLDAAGQPKPAYHALRAFTQAASGRRLVGALQDMPAGAHGLRLVGADDTVFVLWTEVMGATLQVSVPRPGLIDVMNAMGEPAPIATGAAPLSLTLTETDGPVYVRVRR